MKDQIDFNTLVFLESPDVRNWSLTTEITKIDLTPEGVHIEFTKKDKWPDVRPPNWAGNLRYTLWVVVNGTKAIGCIEFWAGLDKNGGPVCDVGQLPKNWYYFALDYQPAPNEQVGFFVTSGDQRRKDVHAITERSNVIVVPFAYGSYLFSTVEDPPIDPPIIDNPTGQIIKLLEQIEQHLKAIRVKVGA